MAVETTLSEQLDQAVERMPPLRRRVYKFRLQNRKYRQRVLEQLQLDLSEDDRVAALGVAAVLADGEFTPYSKIALDPDKLKQFLEIIVEYLPKILEIIMKLFALVLFMLFPSTAFAQCPGGNCNSWRPSTQRVYHVPQTYYQAPQQVYQAPQQVYQVPPSGPLFTSRTIQQPQVTYQQPQQTQPVYQQTQYQQTAQVYHTSSFNSNGSGQSLADHLQNSHGINANGMSVAQQEAAHQAAHSRGSYSNSRVMSGRFRLFRR